MSHPSYAYIIFPVADHNSKLDWKVLWPNQGKGSLKWSSSSRNITRTSTQQGNFHFPFSCQIGKTKVIYFVSPWHEICLISFLFHNLVLLWSRDFLFIIDTALYYICTDQYSEPGACSFQLLYRAEYSLWVWG